MGNLQKFTSVLVLIVIAASCHSESAIGTVSGVVTVAGKPVDTGTIHFQLTGDGKPKGAGALIEDGKFTLTKNKDVTAGIYNVVIQAFTKTGRIFKDPQKGDVPETAPIAVADMPKEVSLTPDNSSNLQIDFKGSGR